MGVEREVADKFGFRGGAAPVRAVRGKAGGWTVHVQLGFDLELRDGRTIRVFRQVRVRAEQIGRKKMSIRFIPPKRRRDAVSGDGA